ncbi:MarR family winged helix-turn-helix transcriptional regulator [Deinococcus yavapaiensis]|uniref:DNA-binding MarR family transcriptional regulator n=1 Tax=Deinococcus yavapaiensis KR-236 TaxID=694435 RepID=A0A318SCT1_9DEIO|nr:MarR family transcriptional regulator [Deinococcus yavapaiensis]PYE56681.1 DNA-binding MarR family transcriptional regulator [Deinococcus yavapaiensis KR-236]
MTQQDSPRAELLSSLLELELGIVWLAHERMRDLLAPHKLAPPHHMILEVLVGKHPTLTRTSDTALSMSDLALGLDIAPASLTAMVDKLEQLGFAKRQPDTSDRRVMRVMATPEGQHAVDTIAEGWRQMHASAYAQFDEEELARHLGALRRLYAHYAANGHTRDGTP